MLITKEVLIKWNSNNKSWYENKGYVFTKMNNEFEVNVEDLPHGSHINVDVKCDECSEHIKNIIWKSYKHIIKDDGIYRCPKCNRKYSYKKMKQTRLKNGKSLEKWCINHKRNDILDKWDHELNDCLPSEINYSTNEEYYFKCLRGLHKSELKQIHSMTNENRSANCSKCNSFAQWGVDNLGEDFLERYWDYKKNIIDPWEISRGVSTKVWIKCQEINCHNVYFVSCACFSIQNSRCPICNISKGEYKIHTFLNVNSIFNIPQKEFDGLLGTGNGNLSYDFYIPKYNLLIEYQGEFHDRAIRYKNETQGMSELRFIKQKEHDKRKKEYAQDNRIKLLEIWYWKFDDIEDILENELNLLSLKEVI